MDKMKRLLEKWFFIALVTSVLMVAAVPLIPVSAVNGTTWLLIV